MRHALVYTALVLGLSACDKGATPPEPAAPSDVEAPAAEPDAAEPAAAVPATWEEAEHADLDAQVEYMKTKVVPAMKPVFQAAAPEEYATFTCATCHGPDKKPPTEYLPHLTLVDGNIQEFETMPDVSKVMAEQIVPAMAEAMGEAPYDPATGEGFGCAGCHAIDS